MAAPILAIVAGWLSATAATAYAPVLLDVSRAETGVAIAYADIRKDVRWRSRSSTSPRRVGRRAKALRGSPA
jgi:hypothetical protein